MPNKRNWANTIDDNFYTRTGAFSHLSKSNVACHCGCGFNMMTQDFIDQWYRLCNIYSGEISIIGGNRCIWQNKHTDNSGENSKHMFGYALDIRGSNNYETIKIIDLAVNIFGGVGLYHYSNLSIHVDSRDIITRWSLINENNKLIYKTGIIK